MRFPDKNIKVILNGYTCGDYGCEFNKTHFFERGADYADYEYDNKFCL